MTLEILDHKQTAKGALYVKVRLSSGMILHGIRIIARVGGLRVKSPTRPVLDNKGEQKRGERDGALLFAPMLTFDSHESGDLFTAAVLAAVRAACPEALARIPLETVNDPCAHVTRSPTTTTHSLLRNAAASTYQPGEFHGRY